MWLEKDPSGGTEGKRWSSYEFVKCVYFLIRINQPQNDSKKICYRLPNFTDDI